MFKQEADESRHPTIGGLLNLSIVARDAKTVLGVFCLSSLFFRSYGANSNRHSKVLVSASKQKPDKNSCRLSFKNRGFQKEIGQREIRQCRNCFDPNAQILVTGIARGRVRGYTSLLSVFCDLNHGTAFLSSNLLSSRLSNQAMIRHEDIAKEERSHRI